MQPEGAAVSWHGRLQLNYTLRLQANGTTGHTVASDRHEGPLRVLKPLYPEGPSICHHVLVHPPGGVAGGDTLELCAALGDGTHALITTPGATRFYRSQGAVAVQHARLCVAAGARLEWLPLETIAYPCCRAENHLRLELAPGAEVIGRDCLALGLPASGLPFDDGTFLQHLEVPGHWLERGRIDATDRRLLDSPLGWDGKRVLATAWFAAGADLGVQRRGALLDAARECMPAVAGTVQVGCTAPNPRVVVVRALAPAVEPAMSLMNAVRAAWRKVAWGLEGHAPRVWLT